MDGELPSERKAVVELAVQPLHPAVALKRIASRYVATCSIYHMEVFFLRDFSAKPAVFAGVFIGLTILFTYVFSIQTPFVRLSFGFLPIAIYASMFGPMRGGLMAAAADLLGSTLFFPGLFFPGFTLSSFLSGVIYGHFLYGKDLSLRRICIPFVLIFLSVDLTLNTLWLVLLYHQAAAAFFLSRFIKNAICLPMQIFLFCMVYKPLAILIPRWNTK